MRYNRYMTDWKFSTYLGDVFLSDMGILVEQNGDRYRVALENVVTGRKKYTTIMTQAEYQKWAENLLARYTHQNANIVRAAAESL